MTLIFLLLLPICYSFDLKDIQIGIFRPVQNDELASLDEMWLQNFSELILPPTLIHKKSHRLQKRQDIEERIEDIEPQPNWFKRQWNRVYNALWKPRIDIKEETEMNECPICYSDIHEIEKITETKCGHKFCSECVSMINVNGTQSMKCPHCRTPNAPMDLKEYTITDRNEQSLLLKRVIGQPWMTRIICHSKQCFLSVLVTLTCAAEFTLVTGLSCPNELWDASLTDKWATILTPTILSSLSFLALSVPLSKLTVSRPYMRQLYRYIHPAMTALTAMGISGVEDVGLNFSTANIIGFAGYFRFRDITVNMASTLIAAFILNNKGHQVPLMNPLGSQLVFGAACQFLNFCFIPWEKVFGEEMTFFASQRRPAKSGFVTMALIERCRRQS